jgi:hypothetical protein
MLVGIAIGFGCAYLIFWVGLFFICLIVNAIQNIQYDKEQARWKKEKKEGLEREIEERETNPEWYKEHA